MVEENNSMADLKAAYEGARKLKVGETVTG